MMRILVAGGAGYIGSHMVKRLARDGCRVTVLDNLSTGHADAVLGGELVRGDLADRALLGQVLARDRFDAVMHFASCIEVAESVRDPGKYYRNNVANTLNLLDAMVAAGVSRLVFSSSAAVYGMPARTPIDETHLAAPINPYGRTKLVVEQMLGDYGRAHALRCVSLRYFNAAGADPEGELGERHEPESHLIPRVLQSASGRAGEVTVFGADYDTEDGTCVRDYIHVADLCDAHLAALRYLAGTGESLCANLGNGNGYSVRQIIDTARAVTRRSFAVREGPRREGDPPRLVADAARAREVLGWQPRCSQLETIIEHAWKWELKLAQGRL